MDHTPRQRANNFTTLNTFLTNLPTICRIVYNNYYESKWVFKLSKYTQKKKKNGNL